jgi:hypothetical protein
MTIVSTTTPARAARFTPRTWLGSCFGQCAVKCRPILDRNVVNDQLIRWRERSGTTQCLVRWVDPHLRPARLLDARHSPGLRPTRLDARAPNRCKRNAAMLRCSSQRPGLNTASRPPHSQTPGCGVNQYPVAHRVVNRSRSVSVPSAERLRTGFGLNRAVRLSGRH